MSPMGTKIYRDSICRTIYNLIRLQGDTTRQFLIDTTRLAPTSLNRVLDRLITAGWITESGLASSTGGRRANLYSQRTAQTAFLVVRINDSTARLALFDPALQLLAQENIDVFIPVDLDSSVDAVEASSNDSGTTNSEDFNTWLRELEQATARLIVNISQERELSPVFALINEDSGLDKDQIASVSNTIASVSDATLLSGALKTKAECAAYGALWNPTSGKLGEATIVLIADLGKTFICQAGDGLRHADGIKAIPADDLIVPLIQGDKPLTMAKAGQADGLLKQFSRIKQSSDITWQDLTTAAAAGKKKAALTMSIAAAAYASTIINSSILVQADHWILTGSMIAELPGLIAETEKQMTTLLKKIDTDLRRLDVTDNLDQLIWQGAVARLLEEQLSLLD